MSWWVKEHIAVSDDETKQLCSIEVDNQTSLPAADQTATAGFIIVRGSSALVLDTGDRYIMNSGGTWIQQPSGVKLDLSGYATTQDLTDGLAEKVDTTTYTAGQAAQETEIGAVAAMGAKNLLDIQHPSVTRGTTYNATSDGGVELTCSNAAWTQYNIDFFPVESGREYTFTLYVDAISGTNNFRVYIRDVDSSGNILCDTNNISAIQTRTVTITPNANTIWVGIYLNNSATAKTASAKIRAMLRRAEITDSTYVPYAPTNRELYEMILALQ